MLILLAIVLFLGLAVYAFMQQPKFGKLPTGERLQRIQQAPNYRNGEFQNISHTPALAEGVSYWAVLKGFLFEKKKDPSPAGPIPSVYTDLLQLDPDVDVLVWFGHSSYFMQIDGKRFLVDPVLSGSASPVPYSVQAYAGTDRYTVADLPPIDYLLISHDHWDHLDYETIVALRPKVGRVFCGLGVGAHFEHWGYAAAQISEHNWHERIPLAEGFTVHTVPARHFSGRGFARNKSLWLSYVLQTPSKRLFIGGDSGYDGHFAEIGTKHGPFDLAILENGQYDKHWPHIHTLPDEILTAARELQARRILPVHSGKFTLANHPWYEPLSLVHRNAAQVQQPVITPMIGELVNLNNTAQSFTPWWETLLSQP